MVTPAARPAGRRGLWIAIALMVLGVVLGVLLVVRGVMSISGIVEDYQRVPADGGGTVQLDETGDYRVFQEFPGANSELTASPAPQVTVTGPDGAEIPVERSSTSENYGVGGRDGRLLGTIEAAAPGEYQVVADGEGDLAFGQSGPLAPVVTILGGVFGGGLLFLAGVVLLIISLVRRASSRKPVPPTAWGPPPGSWGPPPRS